MTCPTKLGLKNCLLFLLFTFFTTVLSHLDFSHGEFGLPSLGKASCDRVALLNLRCMCWVYNISVSKNPPNYDMDYGIFNVRTDVNACDCT